MQMFKFEEKYRKIQEIDFSSSSENSGGRFSTLPLILRGFSNVAPKSTTLLFRTDPVIILYHFALLSCYCITTLVMENRC